jgi:NitT/TauT family transport system substrate-binding protein
MNGKKNYSRRRALQLMGGVAGGLLIHACMNQNGNQTTGESSELTVIPMGADGWIGYTPLIIAQEKGFFAEGNVSIDFFSFDNIQAQHEIFLDKQVVALGLTDPGAIYLQQKGGDFRIILVQDIDVGGMGILAANSIESLKDLRGQTIAVEPGTITHFFLVQTLEQVGLSESDITILDVDGYSIAGDLYQRGKVDSAVTYSPDLNEANKVRTDGRIIYDTSSPGAALAPDYYGFDREFLEKNPQAVEAFVKGIFKGIEFLKENREEGLKIAAPKLEVKAEDLDVQLKGIEFPGVEENLEMLANLQSEAYLGKQLSSATQFLARQGQIDQVPTDIEKLIEPRFVQAVANQ